jgi:hypothetical protein
VHGVYEELRRHKPELLEWLSAPLYGTKHDLPGDEILRNWPAMIGARSPNTAPVQRGGSEAQWLHVAKQIIAGEFDGCDSSTSESLRTGLRSILHPACQRALARLGYDCKDSTP